MSNGPQAQPTTLAALKALSVRIRPSENDHGEVRSDGRAGARIGCGAE